MAKIMVEYDTNTKLIAVKNGDSEVGPLDSVSFYMKGKDEDGKMLYGCDMTSYSKDKENDMVTIQRIYCSEQPQIVTDAQNLLKKLLS